MNNKQHISDSLVTGLDSASEEQGTGGRLESGSCSIFAATLGTTLVAGAVLVAVAMVVLVPATAAVAEPAVSWESRSWIVLRQLD